MKLHPILASFAIAAALVAVPAPKAQAQFSIEIGPAPACPYGYYGYAPYNCAPYGYYGPQWFSDGVFIGAGPWFHGRRDFHGYVENYYGPRYGYYGDDSHRDRDWDRDEDRSYHHFRGDEMRDGRGYYGHWDRDDRRDHDDRGRDRDHGDRGDYGDHGH